MRIDQGRQKRVQSIQFRCRPRGRASLHEIVIKSCAKRLQIFLLRNAFVLTKVIVQQGAKQQQRLRTGFVGRAIKPRTVLIIGAQLVDEMALAAMPASPLIVTGPPLRLSVKIGQNGLAHRAPFPYHALLKLISVDVQCVQSTGFTRSAWASQSGSHPNGARTALLFCAHAQAAAMLLRSAFSKAR